MDPGKARKLNEHVYALSRLSHVHKNVPTPPPPMGPEERKHLRILNFVALFLVTEDKGDVTAVTFRQTPDKIDVYYAKNSPCNGALTSYINHILADIRESNNSPPEMIICKISTRAILKCARKVRSRVSKLLKSLTSVLGDEPWENDKIVDCLFPTAKISSEDRIELVNLVQTLRSLAMKDLEKFKGQLMEVYTVAMQSFTIGKWKGFTVGEDRERLQRRIQKVGDYYGGAVQILNVCRDHQKENIEVFEIPPPMPKLENVWRSSLKIMNAYCAEGKGTDSAKFSSRFPHLHDEPQDELTITSSVHCELTLLLHAMTSTTVPVKIGVSKYCCWLCESYIAAFQALYAKKKKFFVPGFQGKIHSGWLLPPGTPSAIEASMQALLEDALDEIRAEVEAQRRSDSWPAEGEDELQIELHARKKVPDTAVRDWVKQLLS